MIDSCTWTILTLRPIVSCFNLYLNHVSKRWIETWRTVVSAVNEVINRKPIKSGDLRGSMQPIKGWSSESGLLGEAAIS